MGGGREVFLTGGTGFLGRRLVRALIARGDRVRCLVRNTARARDLEALGARIIQGDISDDIALDRGLAGAQAAYHLAGVYDIGLVDRAAMERVNVDGTRAFLRFAEHHRVARIVHVSTAYVLQPAVAGVAVNAQLGGPWVTLYQRTKGRAHELAAAAQERGVPVIVACPGNVYGAGDDGPNGRFIRDLLRHRVPGLVNDPAWFSYAHVDDVTQGLVACSERAVNGVFVLSGEPASVNDFAARVCRLARVRMPPFVLPLPLARLSARLMDAIARPLHLRTTLSLETVNAAAHHRWVHAHERATRELDYQPRSLDEGLPPTVEWFVAELRRT
jgi:nucleoside-diphosphate-sugar epimerase